MSGVRDRLPELVFVDAGLDADSVAAAIQTMCGMGKDIPIVVVAADTRALPRNAKDLSALLPDHLFVDS